MATLTRERIERAKAAFTDAADADAATRQGIIDRLEQDDPDAAEMLRQLLDTHDDPEDDLFKEPVIRLEEVIAEPAASMANAPALGKRYRIIRLLGCGGVGDVYLAEESTPIQRKVAIKVFRPHRLDGQRMRRFGIEARALGTLSHPGIAQVFGAGEATDGRPFLAMEYVPGLPIDEAADEANLDERAILQLFIDLCEAAQHAHQRSIIHRDLKPSNVLVVRKGDSLQVKIIDFGVAKLADEAGANLGSLTLHGQILGTLDYMSPEQRRGGHSDTRSDVYSLGVILYRLLTRRMPSGQRTAMASRGVDEDAVPEPMGESPGWMRRDIETIIGKALAHHPARRYASPLHMAEDVGRLLNGEPVLARRTSLGERAVKALRRHPRTALLSAMLLAVILGLAAHTVISRQRLAQEVQVQRTMIVGLLDEVLDRLYVLTGAAETREAMANSLLERTDQLLLTTPDDPDLLEARARLLMELGNVVGEREGYRHAAELYDESEQIFSQLTATSQADVETWRRYAEVIVRHASTMGWSEEAFARNRDAHAIFERLAEQYPDHPGVLDDLCWSYDRLANFVARFGDRQERYGIQLRRLALSDALLALDETRSLSHFNLMKAHYNLAIHYFETTEEDAMLDHLGEAVTYGERIIAMEPGRIHYREQFVYVLLLQARVAMNQGDYEQARSIYERLDADTSQLYMADPGNYRETVARVRYYAEHAHAARLLAEPAEARALYEEAVRFAQQHPRYVRPVSRRLLRELEAYYE